MADVNKRKRRSQALRSVVVGLAGALAGAILTILATSDNLHLLFTAPAEQAGIPTSFMPISLPHILESDNAVPLASRHLLTTHSFTFIGKAGQVAVLTAARGASSHTAEADGPLLELLQTGQELRSFPLGNVTHLFLLPQDGEYRFVPLTDTDGVRQFTVSLYSPLSKRFARLDTITEGSISKSEAVDIFSLPVNEGERFLIMLSADNDQKFGIVVVQRENLVLASDPTVLAAHELLAKRQGDLLIAVFSENRTADTRYQFLLKELSPAVTLSGEEAAQVSGRVEFPNDSKLYKLRTGGIRNWTLHAECASALAASIKVVTTGASLERQCGPPNSLSVQLDDLKDEAWIKLTPRNGTTGGFTLIMEPRSER